MNNNPINRYLNEGQLLDESRILEDDFSIIVDEAISKIKLVVMPLALVYLIILFFALVRGIGGI